MTTVRDATTSADGAPRDLSGPSLVVASKLVPPIAHPGSVVRAALVERLTEHADAPVVTVVAPPGYGKTTLMQQWAEHDLRPFTWLCLDQFDNDPTVLLTGLALAVDKVVPMGAAVFRALAAPRLSASSAVMRLLAALDRPHEPAVLMLDDAYKLENVECRDALAAVVEHMPPGWQVAIVSREELWLPVARLRAEGRIAEYGTGDLVMDDREASALLAAAGVTLNQSDVAMLNRRAEGWPVVLYLAALAITSDPELSRTTEWPGGKDPFVVDYLQSEVLSRLSTSTVEFLTRTSLPLRLTGPLCDALLDSRGSADRLTSLERANALVIPLDRERRWYRYHHLFRDHLSAELERREPEYVPLLRRRAADWYEANGFAELAVDEAMKLGDAARVARITAESAQSLYQRGRAATILRWFEWIDQRGVVERYPQVAVAGALVHVLEGRAAVAERWIDAAERGVAAIDQSLAGRAAAKGQIAMLRAATCREGIDRMREDAEVAARLLPPGDPWRPAGLVLLGIAHHVTGETERADTILDEAVEVAEDSGASPAASVALAERALLAERIGEVHEWRRLAERACSVIADAGLEDYPTSGLAYAVTGRMYVSHGEVTRAKRLFARAQRLRIYLTHALPVYAVQTRLQLASGYVSLTDVSGARTILREAGNILRKRPDLGNLADEIAELRHQVDALQANMAGASSLTTAELRLLPLLSTHLSFRQIGERLFISPNTVKTEAISIYRKLSVSSRGEAIERARSLGLLADEHSDDPAPIIPSG